MINRGLFVKSVSKLEYDNGNLKMNLTATEINKDNFKSLFENFGESPYSLATLPEETVYENFKEKIEQIQIIEGKASMPLMFTIYTEKSTLTVCKSWFRNETLNYETFVKFIISTKIYGNIRFTNDTLNFLKYGK